MIRRALPLLLALLMVGCAVFQAAQPPTPENPRQVLVLVVEELGAITRAATTMHAEGLIASADLLVVADRAETARERLGVARSALSAGDLTTAEGQLTAVQLVLLDLRRLLGGAL